MKRFVKLLLIITVFIFWHSTIQAQWISPTGSYTYTYDHVGIGETAPVKYFEIFTAYDDDYPAMRLTWEDGSYDVWDIENTGNLDFRYGTTYKGTTSALFTFTTDGNLGIGTTSPGYKVHALGDIYANGGWLRVSGQNGLCFQSYGGGFYMTDATWIRTYGSKSFYHNTGIMRTDGTFQVGPNGDRFLVNTSGKVGIGYTSLDGAKLTIGGPAGTDLAIRLREVDDHDYDWDINNYWEDLHFKYGESGNTATKVIFHNTGDIELEGSGSGIIFYDGTKLSSANGGGGSSPWLYNGTSIYYDGGNVEIGSNIEPLSKLSIYGENKTANLRFTEYSTDYGDYDVWEIKGNALLEFYYGFSGYSGNPTLSKKVIFDPLGHIYASKFSELDNSSYFLDMDNTGTSMVLAGSIGIGSNEVPLSKLSIYGEDKTANLRFTEYSTDYGDYDVWEIKGNALLEFYYGFSGYSGNPTLSKKVIFDPLGHIYASKFSELDNSSYFLDMDNTGTSMVLAGKVGIGVTSPKTTLNINNPNESATKTTFTEDLASAGILITTDYTVNAYTPGLFWSTDNNYSTKPKAGIYLKETGSGTYIYFGTSTSYVTGINSEVVIKPNGTVETKELKIVAQPGADFVFDGSYRLKSLAETEDFINENKRLPGVAPAAYMEENGVEQSKYNQVLLQKIEELTLYVIEQDKKLDAQDKKIEAQQKLIESLLEK